MSYQIVEQLISYNRSHQILSPQGFVIHATDTPNATAQNEHDYFNSGNRQASVHYFADWTQIIRTIPENEVAWHAGSTANHKFLSVEMCEPINDMSKFQEVWNRTIWLVADACVRYDWNTNDNVFSHRGISAMYHETNHTDPIEFLASYGKTWDQLLQAINAKINELKNSQSTTPINNNQGGNKKMEKSILIFTQDDLPSAKRLMNKIGNIPVIFRNSNGTAPDCIKDVIQLFIIGGKEDGSDVNHPNKEVLAGANWFKSADKVAEYLGY